MKIKKEDSYVVIYDNENEIERYSLNEEINFKGLMQFLLKQNLKNKKSLEDYNANDYSTAENNLIKIIKNILESYNTKCSELEVFIKNKTKPNDN